MTRIPITTHHANADDQESRQAYDARVLSRPIEALTARRGLHTLEPLISIINNSNNEQARIAATRELLDRRSGKARPEFDPNDGPLILYVDRKFTDSSTLLEHRDGDTQGEK